MYYYALMTPSLTADTNVPSLTFGLNQRIKLFVDSTRRRVVGADSCDSGRKTTGAAELLSVGPASTLHCRLSDIPMNTNRGCTAVRIVIAAGMTYVVVNVMVLQSIDNFAIGFDFDCYCSENFFRRVE
ncbi:hypothetical protein EVAR_93897_1 [Eumeta japonica]|uniref:Uncharacterized protein n=1 Tax=Eumeta variegata TaxID=151549 RepID=A0A4C1TWT7_EUMVA|nr:hypothetical protein EVAR_93897_1 [Eumeta japonica]